MLCFFVSDLHGHVPRYERLADRMRAERPAGVFLGGDLLPRSALVSGGDEFFADVVTPLVRERRPPGCDIFLILGNDDPRVAERAVIDGDARGDWIYLHNRHVPWRGFDLFGYSYVPPTPFLLKDWERYDVSRYVDPGCVPLEEGRRTVELPAAEIRQATIQADLDAATRERDLSRAIMLFHSPPYDTLLDRAALDGKVVDHAPVDVHVGSMALRRFIETRQPLVTLHGHVHESARLTGSWQQQLGRTLALSAAHDGPELALVRFDPERLAKVSRELIDPSSPNR